MKSNLQKKNKKIKGLDVYDVVRYYHKNRLDPIYDGINKSLNKSEVSEKDKKKIQKQFEKVEDIFYKIERILIQEKYV